LEETVALQAGPAFAGRPKAAARSIRGNGSRQEFTGLAEVSSFVTQSARFSGRGAPQCFSVRERRTSFCKAARHSRILRAVPFSIPPPEEVALASVYHIGGCRLAFQALQLVLPRVCLEVLFGGIERGLCAEALGECRKQPRTGVDDDLIVTWLDVKLCRVHDRFLELMVLRFVQVHAKVVNKRLHKF
jgi:hypothetical protein